MALPSIYLNLEDDVARVTAMIKKVRFSEVVLVCPKRCQLFSDVINLRLLKKQTDLLGKKIYILTMDETGKSFAKEAGFPLKEVPGVKHGGASLDIGRRPEKVNKEIAKKEPIKKITSIKVTTQPAELLEQEKIKEVELKVNNFIPNPKIRITQNVYPEAELVERTQKKQTGKKKKKYAITGLVVLFLIALLAVAFVFLPHGQISVYARSEPVVRDMQVSISTLATSSDPNQLILPATKISQTLDATDTFQNSGKKEVGNKASGTVYIYNFTRTPLNLKATTTTLKLNNYTYSLIKDVQIRPTTYSNPTTKEIDKNSVDTPVEVVASTGGDEYNVPQGTRIEISNQVFGSKPQVLYAQTATAITGGTSRFLSVVTDQDEAAAHDALGQEIINNLRTQLSGQGLILPDKAFSIQQVAFNADKQTGTESPTLQASLKAVVTGLAYNKNDLDQLIYDHIKQTISDNKVLDPMTDKNITVEVKNIDLNAGTAIFDLHFEGLAVWNVDLGDIKANLVGKNPDQVNEMLTTRPEIEKIDIILTPKWQKTFPYFQRNIQVNLVK